MVIEYMPENEDAIVSKLKGSSVPFQVIGKTTREKRIRISLFTDHHSPFTVLDEDMRVLRAIWEETSHQLDRLQRDHSCVEEEKKNIYDRKGQSFSLSFEP